MPPVEAQSVGVPVVVSKVSSLPEVVGGSPLVDDLFFLRDYCITNSAGGGTIGTGGFANAIGVVILKQAEEWMFGSAEFRVGQMVSPTVDGAELKGEFSAFLRALGWWGLIGGWTASGQGYSWRSSVVSSFGTGRTRQNGSCEKNHDRGRSGLLFHVFVGLE